MGAGNDAAMKRLPSAIALTAVAALWIGACASHGDPGIDAPTDDEEVPFDPTVNTGVDTEVEQSGNLEFDEPDEG